MKKCCTCKTANNYFKFGNKYVYVIIVINMTQKSEFGKKGEDMAAEFLQKQGYKIIGRNYRKPWGEIDIICQAPDKTLVFVEVKTMRTFNNIRDNQNETNSGIMPEDHLTKAKLRKINRTALMYTGQNQNLIYENRGFRIDLIALTFDDKNVDVKHYQNI